MTETAIKPIYRSVSQLTSYIECGEAYKLERIDKVRGKPAAWFQQGTAFHEAIEHWEGHNRQPDLEEVLEVYYNAWDEGLAEVMDFGPDEWLTGTAKRDGPADIELRRAKGEQQVIDYIEFALSQSEVWRVLSLDDGPAVEREFKLTIPYGDERDADSESRPLVVVGFIDQMIEYRNGVIRPRDMKTGTKRPSWEIQLGVYAVAMRDVWGLPAWSGDFYMAKDKGITKPYDLKRYTRDYVEDLFQQLERGIEAETFLPHPGSFCHVCPVREFCSVWKEKK